MVAREASCGRGKFESLDAHIGLTRITGELAALLAWKKQLDVVAEAGNFNSLLHRLLWGYP